MSRPIRPIQDCVIESASPETTRRLGAALAALLPQGAVVALRGDLATGKTCLVSGMATHFTVADYVHSPTFTLVNQYGEEPALMHVDLYRLSGPDEVADLGYAELFDSEDVCVVEWARTRRQAPAGSPNGGLARTRGIRRAPSDLSQPRPS
ncbi:MAG: tRNA (adenosine(37)-N6)-threonylcarbamoyltransferase complex ATPase subunit type 1 TsaE [Candidatus Hydrogenedentales bacterium]